jgi:hypothetical protein
MLILYCSCGFRIISIKFQKTTMSKVTDGIIRRNRVKRLSNGKQERIEGLRAHSTQELFELGEGILDGGDIRRVGMQKEQTNPTRMQQGADGRRFADSMVVEDNKVAGMQNR